MLNAKSKPSTCAWTRIRACVCPPMLLLHGGRILFRDPNKAASVLYVLKWHVLYNVCLRGRR